MTQTQRMTWALLAIERAQRELATAREHISQAPQPDQRALGDLHDADRAITETWSRIRPEARP